MTTGWTPSLILLFIKEYNMEEVMIKNESTSKFLELIATIKKENPLVANRIQAAEKQIELGTEAMEGMEELINVIEVHIKTFCL